MASARARARRDMSISRLIRSKAIKLVENSTSALACSSGETFPDRTRSVATSLIRDTNRVVALGVATKLLDLFRTRNFGGGDTLIKMKGSAGVVSYPEDPLFSVEEMIDAGEESIYRVKERGGDETKLVKLDVAVDELLELISA